VVVSNLGKINFWGFGSVMEAARSETAGMRRERERRERERERDREIERER
jgi:hypothetical protein